RHGAAVPPANPRARRTAPFPRRPRLCVPPVQSRGYPSLSPPSEEVYTLYHTTESRGREGEIPKVSQFPKNMSTRRPSLSTLQPEKLASVDQPLNDLPGL